MHHTTYYVISHHNLYFSNSLSTTDATVHKNSLVKDATATELASSSAEKGYSPSLNDDCSVTVSSDCTARVTFERLSLAPASFNWYNNQPGVLQYRFQLIYVLCSVADWMIKVSLEELLIQRT